MGITMLTTKKQLDVIIRNKFEDIEKKVLNVLMNAGEQAVRQARLKGSYQDRTGNLRSSIGYVIVKRGEVVHQSAFNVVKGGQEGSKEGLSLALDLVKNYPTDNVLIVVAGMNYATYVERKGFDVLSSAQLKAEEVVKKLIAQL